MIDQGDRPDAGQELRVRAAGHSETGPVRAGNEDAMCLDSALGLFAVADGMGGHRAGEVASHMALDTLVEQIAASRRPGFGWPMGRDPGRDTAGNELAHAVHVANARVVDAGERDPELSGMGTTLTALAVGADGVTIVSVGDSRAYLVRDGVVEQLTHDDTWLATVLGREGAREAAARAHPMRHVLTSIVGAKEGAAPEVVSHDARRGDIFVLTTDGLHNVVDDETIGRLAVAGAPEDAAPRLVDEALARRTTDNATVVLLRLE
ncbi:MAG: PP2C family serine/threonine-protein phosphatase [Vicinamibacterales bacterium]